MLQNQLKINDDKTEFLIITSKQKKNSLPCSLKLRVGSCDVLPSKMARNLGVIFDNELRMDHQIANMCKGMHHHLRTIGSIRHLLTIDATEKLVHAIISSRLDYCNSLLVGLPAYQLRRLQSLQNSAARLVSRTRKYDHIKPILKQLHWLPVDQRIIFKILLLTFKIQHNKAPSYLQAFITPYSPQRTLRSADKMQLVVPNSFLKNYGNRCFQHAAAEAWNILPLSIKQSHNVDSFKRNIKTFLFEQAFL